MSDMYMFQVFQYDGTLSCTGIEFGLFVLIGLAVVVFFVAPAPFAVGYICRKRPQVGHVTVYPVELSHNTCTRMCMY